MKHTRRFLKKEEMKLGADDFFEKSVDLPILLQKIQQIEQQLSVDEDVATVSAVKKQ